MTEHFADTELGEMLHENEEQITRQIAEAIASRGRARHGSGPRSRRAAAISLGQGDKSRPNLPRIVWSGHDQWPQGANPQSHPC
jgi:hypothetical protein